MRITAEGVADAISSAAGSAPNLVNVSFERGLLVETERGALSRLQRWREGWASVMIALPGGRTGFAWAVIGAEPFDARALVSRALATSRIFPADPSRFIPDRPFSGQAGDLGIFDENWSAEDEDSALSMALRLEEAAKARAKGVRVRKPSFEGILEQRLVALNGLPAATWDSTSFGLHVEVAASRGEHSESGWAGMETRAFSALDPEKTGTEAAQRAVELLGAHGAPTGRFPVVLDRRAAAEALDCISHSFLADSARKRTSLFTGKMGAKIFSDIVGVVDDGTFRGGPETSPADFDGEGRRRNVCVDGGVLKALLFDRAEAARQGASSTGNASGSSGGPPMPGTTNLHIPNGTTPAGKLPSLVGRGMIVREVMGFHTADPISGDFSVGCSGLWVEGGEIAYPVTGAALSGNLAELFSRVAFVGDDMAFSGSSGAPSLLTEGLSVSGD